MAKQSNTGKLTAKQTADVGKNRIASKKANTKKQPAAKKTAAKKPAGKRSAPKGNKNAVGANSGQPPFYNTPDELKGMIEGYFEWIKGEWHEENREVWDDKTEELRMETIKVWDRPPEPATVTGLTLYLGFMDKQSLYDYSKRGIEFSCLIKKARTRVENEYEKCLYGEKPTGAIFALKNMGWSDKPVQNEGVIDFPAPVIQVFTTPVAMARSESEVDQNKYLPDVQG